MNDYIRKKDVLSAIHEYIIENRFSHWWIARVLRDIKTRILLLPPTTDIRKNIKAKKVINCTGTGTPGGMTHWHECSVCRKVIDYEDNFCRHCGADLRDDTLLEKNNE